jgi:hypothetical protein
MMMGVHGNTEVLSVVPPPTPVPPPPSVPPPPPPFHSHVFGYC